MEKNKKSQQQKGTNENPKLGKIGNQQQQQQPGDKKSQNQEEKTEAPTLKGTTGDEKDYKNDIEEGQSTDVKGKNTHQQGEDLDSVEEEDTEQESEEGQDEEDNSSQN